MAERSMYARGGSGMTTGGLDGYLGPEAEDFSNLPEHIEEHEVTDDVRKMDCAGSDKDEAVCQIAEAVKEQQAKLDRKEIDQISRPHRF